MRLKLANQLGLINKAGKLVYGTDNIIALMKSKKVSLVILSSEASFNTQKLIQDKADTYNTDVLLVNVFDDNNLSKALGRNNVVVVGIKGKEFKRMILKNIKE